MSDWRSAKEWGDTARLLGIDPEVMPHSKKNVIEKAERENWPRQKRQKQGGGWEYPRSALPEAMQKVLRRQALATRCADQPPAIPAPQRPHELKDYQRTRMEACAALLAEVDRLVLEGHSQGRAVATLVEMARDGSLPPELMRLVPIANARSGKRKGAKGGRTLSRTRIYGWLKERADAGGDVAALAPKPVPEAPIPAWADPMMELWGRPVKHSLAYVVDELAKQLPAGQVPSYDQARRFLGRLDVITRNTGRMGPRALKSLKAYHARDVSELWPGAVFIGDGHTFKTEWGHPIHGRPFRPEVTTAIDAFTRRICGWSVALAESAAAVADCFRHACMASTTPDIWYYDNGSGANNEHFDDPITGLLARVGTTKKNSIAWNSQARGIIEIIHKTVYHRAAKRLPTYVGKDMDREAREKAFKVTRADIKATGASRILPSWADFLAFMEETVAEYNDRPHSSLPKTRDPITGRVRPMTPNEAWAKAIAEGWQPDPITAEDAVDLFRPAVRRKTNRDLVSLFGNEYSGRGRLEPFGGDDVMVSYDIHDASRVWVRALDGRFICEAEWDAHKTSYFPVPVAEQARQRRVEQKIKRLDAHKDTALAELRAPLLEHQPATPMPEIVSTGPVVDAVAVEIAAEPPKAKPLNANGRPLFGTDAEWARWLTTHPDQATADDLDLLRQQLRSRSFRELLDWDGIDVGTLETLLKRKTEAA